MIKSALVAIGVSRVPTLPLLQTEKAVRAICKWAKSQNFDVTSLTDEDGRKVALQDVEQAVAGYVRPGTYDQLLVYFAGHGFNKGTNADFWLLSDAPLNGNAA